MLKARLLSYLVLIRFCDLGEFTCDAHILAFLLNLFQEKIFFTSFLGVFYLKDTLGVLNIIRLLFKMFTIYGGCS